MIPLIVQQPVWQWFVCIIEKKQQLPSLDKEEMKREFGEYFEDGTGGYLMPELGSDEMKRSWIPME